MDTRFRTIIVDDEQLSIDVITDYIKAFPALDVVATCTKSRQAIDKILELKPDLLFLDIHLPVINGFQLIEAIIEKHNPYIIFTTAFDKYAVRAFEVNAIGYLLKPFDKEKFAAAVNKFLTYNRQTNTHDLYDGIVKMLDEKQKAENYATRVLIKEQKKIFYLPLSDIQHFEAKGDYIKVVSEKKSYLVNDSLAALELRLSPQEFIRIHRSIIVNASYITEFIPYFNHEYHLVMRNGEMLKMSRHYRENLLRVFTDLK